MADASEVGKYGTVRLLKRREPSAVVASYPIDEEEVTFGRDPACSVRLYYQWVSSVHCKLVFEERKAFLQILGANGVIVDGCPVFPAKNAQPGASPTTVPLPNGSTFEIHKKLFIFNYPPKELRLQLFTPVAESKRRGNLRMSMVHSAQVFSPAPSPNPRENLRILQSPLKLSSLAEEEPITLVDGNNPLVFQEEQDLVILEDVDPSKRGSSQPSLPQLPQLPPQTPRRKSIPSLHRAVLIRSAQRVAQMRELQSHRQRMTAVIQPEPEVIEIDDDAIEEEEVEEAVSSDLIDPEEDGDAMDEDENEDDEQGDEAEPEDVNESMDDEQDITEARNEYEDDLESQPVQSTPVHARRAPQLGKFMTPQPGQISNPFVKEEEEDVKLTAGPQRPPPGYRFSLAPGLGNGTISFQASAKSEEVEAVPTHSRSVSPAKPKPEVTEEERKAIIERRKSALKAPDADFGDHIPGLGARRTSILPVGSTGPTSPFKNIRETIDKGEDTRSVLQRLEESLEDMRKKSSRQSSGRCRGAGFLPSPEKPGFSLLARGSTPLSPKIIKRDLRMPSYGRDMSALTKGTASQLLKDETEEHEGDMDVDEHEDGKTKVGATDSDDDDVASERVNSPSKEARANRRARRSEIVTTPRMEGLKEMLHIPKTAVGLTTPAMRGMRDLFREQIASNTLGTPRMDGMRSLFSERRVPATPAFDGIYEMMPEQDEGIPEEEEQDDEADNEPEPSRIEPEKDDAMQDEPASELKTQPVEVPRTIPRPKARLVRSTLTDGSTMADDEMTPDPNAAPPKKKVGKASEEEGAIVHKTSRARKTATSKKIPVEESVETKPKKPASRQKTTTESEANSSAPKTKPKTRTRKADTSTTATEADADAAPAPKATHRSRTASAHPDNEKSAPVPVARKTRARSRSVEPENETATEEQNSSEDPLANAAARFKRSTRAKVGAAAETIPEEEEAVPAPAKVLQKSSTRSKKMQSETESGQTDKSVPLKKKPASSGRSKNAKDLAASESDAIRKEDKENTPERSPVSSNDSNESEGQTKATRARPASRTGAAKFAPARSATRTASKAAKTTTDEDAVAVAPRTTRTTRARK